MIKSKLYSQKNKNLLEKLRSARLEVGLTQIQASKKLKHLNYSLLAIQRFAENFLSKTPAPHSSRTLLRGGNPNPAEFQKF